MHAEPGPPGSHLQQEESSSWPSPRWWLGGRGHQGGLPTGERGCSPPGLSPLSQGKAGFSGAFGSEPPDCRGAGSSRPLWTAFKSSRTTSPWHPRLAVGGEVGVQAPGSHCHTTGGLRASEHRVVRVAQLGKCRRLRPVGRSQLSLAGAAGPGSRRLAGPGRGRHRRALVPRWPRGALPSVSRSGAGLAGGVPAPVPGR